jgi:hypothetical protein
MCDAGFSGDGLTSCTRCTSEGTGKSVSFDGYDDKATLSVSGTSLLQMSGSSGLTAQVWFTRDGAATFTSQFDYDEASSFSAHGVQIGLDSSGSLSFEPVVTYMYNASVMSNSCSSNCDQTFRVNVAGAGIARADGLYQLNSPFYNWIDTAYPYYVLEGTPNVQAGLVDLYVNTGYSGKWVISVDGVEKYITEGTNICGPWISWAGRNAGTAPSVGCNETATTVGYTQGLAMFFGLQGSNLVAGATITDADNAVHRMAVQSQATVVDGRWHRATILYSTTTSQLTLMLDTVTVGAASHAGSSSILLETDPTLILSGDALSTGSSGAFKGRIRDARFWSRHLDAYDISHTDCISGSPLIWFKWAAAADTGDGCPVGDYCRTWLSPATCQTNIHISCGTVTQDDTSTSAGTLADATWTLSGGATPATDWPLMLHDGTSYWNKLEYGTSRDPCTGNPSCSMALDHTLALPTPVFQYLTGLKQEHVGSVCSSSGELARVLLNSQSCLRGLSGGSWVSAYGNSYTVRDTWNCGTAFVGQGIQQRQLILQTGSVSCTLPSSGPALVLGSGDGYVYVQA